MEKFEMYVPAARGRPAGITIADLVPVGRENAISRKMLVALCVEKGLVSDSIKDKDRAMRDLIGEARMEHPIINMSHGDGYYQPRTDSEEEMRELNAFIQQEEGRGSKIFRRVSIAKDTYEDFIRGRFERVT